MSADTSHGTLRHWRSLFWCLPITILVVLLLVILVALIKIIRPQATPWYDAGPANSQLSEVVRNSTKIIDSLSVSHSGAGYQLDVLVNKDEQASFTPVGLQLVDDNSTTLIATSSLDFQPQLACFDLSPVNLSRKDAYQTPWLAGNQFDIYAYKQNKSVTLFVKTTGGIFAVHGLAVSGTCSWTVE